MRSQKAPRISILILLLFQTEQIVKLHGAKGIQCFVNRSRQFLRHKAVLLFSVSGSFTNL